MKNAHIAVWARQAANQVAEDYFRIRSIRLAPGSATQNLDAQNAKTTVVVISTLRS
jgi:hypothetical protein